MNNDIERIDFWKRELSIKITEKDLEQAFEAGRKKVNHINSPTYVFDSFYDYKKTLIKKTKNGLV